MRDIFIPKTKNPPAKVKDTGLIKLVMDGRGVYSARDREIYLLPAGCSDILNLSRGISETLLNESGFQMADCNGSWDAVFSMADRYAREYHEDALSWMEHNARNISLHSWFPQSGGDAQAKTTNVLETLTNLIRGYLPSFTFIKEVLPEVDALYRGVCETEKGSLHSTPALKCSACGELLTADSLCEETEPPVNINAALEEVKDVHTPGAHTIPFLCGQLGITSRETLKAMLYTMEHESGHKELLFAMIRGDKNISLQKLSAYITAEFRCSSFRKANPDEIVSSFGEVAGFCGPIGVPENVHMVADLSLVDGRNFVVGGNRPDYHKTGCCWGRDFNPPTADLILHENGGKCPKCGGELTETYLRGICYVECYNSVVKVEPVLTSRDREGQFQILPRRLHGEISLESLLLAILEKGNIETV